jgi:endonuclease/exonuclease/phosphatase family metal-dependent hydrolase
MAETKRKKGKFRRFMQVLTVICLFALLCSYLSPFVHPSTFWILPFFGLSYPVIIAATLLFLIYWALLRSRWTFIVLFFVLIGGNLHFRTFAVTFSPPEAEAEANIWKVMSYNVRLFDVYNADEAGRYASRAAIISYVDSLQPDVVCFQEFYQEDAPTDFSTRDTIIDLLGVRDYQERYSHKLRGRKNFGICMLSRYPMIAKGDVMFETQNSDNYCVFADIVKNGDTMRVYNIHLQSVKLQEDDYALFGDKSGEAKVERSTVRLLIRRLRVAYPERADQARRVMEHMATSPYPVIICGDFNDTPMSYVYNQFDKLMVDSYRETSKGMGRTYVGRVPAGRIDYIFHTQDLAARNFTIQRNASSDHLAVSCEIWRPQKK